MSLYRQETNFVEYGDSPSHHEKLKKISSSLSKSKQIKPIKVSSVIGDIEFLLSIQEPENKFHLDLSLTQTHAFFGESRNIKEIIYHLIQYTNKGSETKGQTDRINVKIKVDEKNLWVLISNQPLQTLDVTWENSANFNPLKAHQTDPLIVGLGLYIAVKRINEINGQLLVNSHKPGTLIVRIPNLA